MTAALEEVKTIPLSEWLTLATAPSSTKLKPGQTPYAYNTWVDEKPGSVITAPGFFKVGSIPSNNPPTFCINYFKTSAGTQTFVVSDNATVWTTVDFVTFTQIIGGLSASFQLRGAVIRDKLWLTNGNDAVRTFDGTTVTVLDGTSGTPNVPKGRFISYHDERVWLGHIPSGRSQCYFSALTDSGGSIIDPDNASAWPNNNFSQVSQGEADFITGLLIYRGFLHFFKQYSIWRLVGYDEYTYTRVKTRASTGTRFAESIQILDNLVHMIGVDGIYTFDGENTERISDIIDPATAEQTSFGFNTLQQPNTNNQFWETESTSDWSGSAVPFNLHVDNAITLEAFDDTQAEFQQAASQTNIDLVGAPGAVQLATANAGVSAPNIFYAEPCSQAGQRVSFVGNPSSATDGDLNTAFGANPAGTFPTVEYTISFPSTNFTRIILRKFTCGNGGTTLQIRNDRGDILTPTSVQSSSGNVGQSINGQNVILPSANAVTFTIDYISDSSLSITLTFTLAAQFTMTEIEGYATAYATSGQLASRTLDLGDAPASFGKLTVIRPSALVQSSPPNAGYTVQTQSSSDGVNWDNPVSVTNNGTPINGNLNTGDINSVPRRYLRYVLNLISDGNYTDQVIGIWVGSLYESPIHDTGGNIFAWGAFQAEYATAQQTINFYYRGGTTQSAIRLASWNAIAPGGAVNMPTANRYVQFKVEISVGNAQFQPSVTSVTINWVAGTGIQQAVLQNVASAYWRNRYWLSAAGPGAKANNTVLIRGKKTFGGPWQLKDWAILAFTRYLDNFYGTSSVDGSIYQLDTGYSKSGIAMNSIFETGDFTFEGFQSNILEILIETQRLGSYTLYVGTSIDQGQTWTDHAVDLTRPTGGSLSFWKRINNLNLTTDKLRLRFYTNAVDQPWQVHNAIISYKLSQSRGTVGTN